MLRIGLIMTLHPSKGRARALWGAPIDVQKIKKIRAARRFGALHERSRAFRVSREENMSLLGDDSIAESAAKSAKCPGQNALERAQP